MIEVLSLALANLTSPAVLFFALGIFAGVAKSDLNVPEAVAKGLALYLMLAIVFFGFAITQREGGHVRADIFFDMFPLRVRKGLEIVYLLAALAVFALIAYAAGRASLQHINAGRWTTGVVSIPTGPSWAIACIGSGVLSLRLALQAVMLLRGGEIAGRGHAHDPHA